MDLSKDTRWVAELGVCSGQPDSKALCAPVLELAILKHHCLALHQSFDGSQWSGHPGNPSGQRWLRTNSDPLGLVCHSIHQEANNQPAGINWGPGWEAWQGRQKVCKPENNSRERRGHIYAQWRGGATHQGRCWPGAEGEAGCHCWEARGPDGFPSRAWDSLWGIEEAKKGPLGVPGTHLSSLPKWDRPRPLSLRSHPLHFQLPADNWLRDWGCSRSRAGTELGEGIPFCVSGGPPGTEKLSGKAVWGQTSGCSGVTSWQGVGLAEMEGGRRRGRQKNLPFLSGGPPCLAPSLSPNTILKM